MKQNGINFQVRFAHIPSPPLQPTIYPDHPGYKERNGTSEEAARAISPAAGRLRRLVLGEFQKPANDAGMTADEAARCLGLSVLTVRPRVSELGRAGELRKTGDRRKNVSGMSASVWTLAAPLPTTSLPKAGGGE